MGITTIKASEEEKRNGKWSIDNLRLILEAMHTDGIAVLENLIDPTHLDELNKVMVKDAVRIRETTDRLNFGTENIQQAPPLQDTELIHDDFLINKLLFQPILHVLGPECKWDFVSGNTALPNSSSRQPVHSDDKCPYLQKTFYVVANIPLIDVGPENGVTEFWPGTHRLRSLDSYNPDDATIKKDRLDKQRKMNPPVQPSVKKGSIIIRDLMLWHCGVGNESNDIRCMSALGYSASWWKNDAAFKVPSDQMGKELVDKAASCGITARYKVVDSNFNYEKDLHDFNLNEKPELRGSID